jgi:hypothetical protein
VMEEPYLSLEAGVHRAGSVLKDKFL